MKNYLLSIFVLVLLAQCKNSKESTSQSLNIEEVATTKLGEKAVCQPNASGNYQLCSAKHDLAKNAGMGVNFMVIDSKNKSIVYESSVDKGSVSWHGEDELAIFYTPGMMREGYTRDNYTYIYNLKTGTKTKKIQTEE